MKKNTSLSVAVPAKSTPAILQRQSQILTADEQDEFEELESVIRASAESCFKAGAALAKIRDQKLHREQYETFEEYCKKRWDYSRSYCARLADMHKVMEDLKPYEKTDAMPTNESQARVFVPLNTEQRLILIKDVKDHSKTDLMTAAEFNKRKNDLFPFLAKSKTKSSGGKATVIDVEVVKESQENTKLGKVLELATKIQKQIETEKYQGELKELVNQFITELSPFINKSGKGAEKAD